MVEKTHDKGREDYFFTDHSRSSLEGPRARTKGWVFNGNCYPIIKTFFPSD